MKLQSILRKFKKRCTQCPDGRLESRSWIRATCVNDKGERYPNSWTYYECDSCKCKLKFFINGKIEAPTEGEWLLHCKKQVNGSAEPPEPLKMTDVDPKPPVIFSFNEMVVGEISNFNPTTPGDLLYMPYRGLGHYQMQKALKETGQAICTLREGDHIFMMTIVACPKYGVLTATEIKVSRD